MINTLTLPNLTTHDTLYLSLTLLTSLLALFHFSRSGGRSKLPTPPGPKGWPVIGNVLDFPSTKQPKVFFDWARKYGPMTYLSVLGQPILILNTQDAAIDLLDKKSAIYSDRPYLAMAGEIVGWDRAMSLTPYGPNHRGQRKLFQSFASGRHAEKFWAVEEEETKRFLVKLYEQPGEFREHIKWVFGSMILRISYGYTAKSTNDPKIANAQRVMDEFSRASEPGKWFVDFMPVLRHLPTWFPGAGFKRIGLGWRESAKDLVDNPYEDSKAKMHKSEPNFVSLMLTEPPSGSSPDPADHEYFVMWAAANLYGGGADTTVSALTSFFLSMTLYPSIQATAQKELDTYLSLQHPPNRLPLIEDRPNVPYVGALIKEVLRWGSVVPTGLPHRVSKEDVIPFTGEAKNGFEKGEGKGKGVDGEGWRIPEGTIVIPNIWGICHDPSIYPNPDIFDPTRFLGPNPQKDPRNTAFGYGRRICPGQAIAEQSLFIVISSILHSFDISVPRGEVGRVVDYTDGTISHPGRFKCDIKLREGRSASAFM